MLKVATAVEEIVKTSEFAMQGLENGCLNYSAYAEIIVKRVEKRVKKPVKPGTIVAALRRLSLKSGTAKPYEPKIEAHNIITRSDLTEIAYVKTPASQRLVNKLSADTTFTNSPFFVVTQGVGELSIITTTELAEQIQELSAPLRPRLFLTGLAGLSMQTTETGIETPNQFYTIIKQFALQRINIVEFVTTYTELTFVLAERDLKQAFNLLYDAFFVAD